MVATVGPKGSPVPSRRRMAGPIDMMHLGRQALGDEGLEFEILRLFGERVRVYFERLEQATNVTDLLHHLHTLKGASVGVGAWSLAEHAHVMESELKAGEPVSPERVDDIHLAVEEVRQFIAEKLAAAKEAE